MIRESATVGSGTLSMCHDVSARPRPGQVNPVGQPGRRRRKPIAALERAADRRAGIAAFGELDDAPGRSIS